MDLLVFINKIKSMLEIKNITFGYNNYKLFENLSFNVNYGEIVKISGTNGSGKTTLLNCINGFLRLQSGEIIFDGEKINDLPVFKISNLGIKRYIPDREFHGMKIEDILRLVYNKTESKKILEVFKYSGKQISGKLSGGERTLLYLILTLKGAKVVLLDEPFNNLDQNKITLIRDFILKLKQNNIAVIVTDHSNNIEFDKEIKMKKIDYSIQSNVVDYNYDFLINTIK